MNPRSRALGATIEGQNVHFALWAPERTELEVVLYEADGETVRESVPMEPQPGGYFFLTIPRPAGRLLYRIRCDGSAPFPDPYSRSQPFGVHGPAEVVAFDFPWTDAGFAGLTMDDLVLYEVHVGTATEPGTLDALAAHLGYLKALGITAVELMPVASFAGRWNWGYDGVSLFAPFAGYGGPEGLARFVDAAHAHGVAVLMDVVYNHLGPDGNYLGALSSRYQSRRHHAIWGASLNLDDAGSEVVRELVLSNVEMWIRDYHLDGLRLDATDAIFDDSRTHILEEIAVRAQSAAGARQVVIIAEDDRNDARLVTDRAGGGFGLDGVWAGDFHHALRRCLTGDHEGYFADFTGSALDVATALDRGWVFEGRPALRTEGKPRGTQADPVHPKQMIHFIQNHDQVGNRALGDRMGSSVSASVYRAVSALLLLSPYTPLLFMGQEWNAKTPFPFFSDHHPELGRQVTEGRRREYPALADGIPDPQDPRTFLRAKVAFSDHDLPENAPFVELTRELLHLRRTHPALLQRDRGTFSARPAGGSAVVMHRNGEGTSRLIAIASWGGPIEVRVGEGWKVLLTTDEPRFGGAPGSPTVVLQEGTARLPGPMAAVLVDDR